MPSAKARHRKESEPALPDTEQTLVRSTVLKTVLFQLIDQLTYRRRKASQKFFTHGDETKPDKRTIGYERCARKCELAVNNEDGGSLFGNNGDI